MTELEFIRRVLAAFDTWHKADVFWRVEPDGVKFFADVADVFVWGSADCEEVRREDVVDLERAKVDLLAIEGSEPTCLAELYAARKRRERPQGAWYRGTETAVRALFDACGPLREVGLGNPSRHPDEAAK